MQPLLAGRLTGHVPPFRWVGENHVGEVFAHVSDRFVSVGAKEDLQEELDRARVFVAPIRFGAGISLKLLHAAAAGIPAVCTPFIAEALGWKDRVEVLIASTPEEFASCCAELHEDVILWEKVRANALAAVKRDYSHQAYVDAVAAVLAEHVPWFMLREPTTIVAPRLASEIVL